MCPDVLANCDDRDRCVADVNISKVNIVVVIEFDILKCNVGDSLDEIKKMMLLAIFKKLV